MEDPTWKITTDYDVYHVIDQLSRWQVKRLEQEDHKLESFERSQTAVIENDSYLFNYLSQLQGLRSHIHNALFVSVLVF